MPATIVCPCCKRSETRILDSRPIEDKKLPWPYYQGCGSRRRFKCLSCDFRWSTHEIATASLTALASALEGNPPTEEPLSREIGLHIGTIKDD